jgi:hypothetical protein
MRAKQLFTVFTLFKPYIMLLYCILMMHKCIQEMRFFPVARHAANVYNRNAGLTPQERIRKVMKHCLPPTLMHSPKWWAQRLADLKCIVNEIGLPTVFLTLTADEFSGTAFPEIQTLSEFVAQLPFKEVRCYYLMLSITIMFHYF